MGCKKPEAERVGCQSRAGAVYDGGELVLIIGRARWWKFQRGVATAGGVWAEVGGGRVVVVVVRLRGGEEGVEDRAARTGGLSAMAMDGRAREEVHGVRCIEQGRICVVLLVAEACHESCSSP